MAVDMFIKFDGVDGESTDKKHAKEIDVLSYSWGVSNSGTTHIGGGGGAGKANFQDLSFVKYVDKASPNLFMAAATGKHFDSVKLTIRKAGGADALEYLVYELTEVLITSYQTGASGGEDRQTESISLNFAKVKMSYTEQNDKGAAAGGAIDKTYNIAENAVE